MADETDIETPKINNRLRVHGVPGRPDNEPLEIDYAGVSPPMQTGGWLVVLDDEGTVVLFVRQWSYAEHVPGNINVENHHSVTGKPPPRVLTLGSGKARRR